MNRRDIIERRIIDAFENINRYNYNFIGSTIAHDESLIILTYEVRTPVVTGNLDVMAVAGDNLTMKANYEDSVLLNYPDIQIRIEEDFMSVCAAVNTYVI